ncbi:MAG: permease [SAR324 cluster bacterium]|nr:permease [SAR324 cluster bacterium]
MTTHSLAIGNLWKRTQGLDRVWLAIGLVFGVILLASPARFEQSVGFTLGALAGISPYLLISVALAAYLKAAGADHLIARVFSGNPVLMVVSASLFGALSPFCSCGVIPLIAALLAMGVPLAPVMAFWVTSPLMAPDMFVITAAQLGLGFAISKTVLAVAIGLLAGFGTLAVQKAGGFARPLREGVGDGSCGGSVVRSLRETNWRVWQEPERRAELGKSAWQTGLFLLKWLTLAFVLESLMVAYLPADVVGVWLGGDSLSAIPLAVLVGVPAYLNGYAAIPVVAGLMDTGMAPGAAMSFMMAGAMTSIPAAIAVFALARRPVFVWYIALALVGSALSGLLYQAVA